MKCQQLLQDHYKKKKKKNGGKAIPKPVSGIGGRKFLEIQLEYNDALNRERAANIISRMIAPYIEKGRRVTCKDLKVSL